MQPFFEGIVQPYLRCIKLYTKFFFRYMKKTFTYIILEFFNVLFLNRKCAKRYTSRPHYSYDTVDTLELYNIFLYV